MARDDGEDLVDLAWRARVVLVATVGQPGLGGEHVGTQGSVVSAACHLLQQRPPRLHPRRRGTRRGRDADDQDWLVLLLNKRRPTQFVERLERQAVAGQWSGADVWQQQQAEWLPAVSLAALQHRRGGQPHPPLAVTFGRGDGSDPRMLPDKQAHWPIETSGHLGE